MLLTTRLLDCTQSLCPQCLKPIAAEIVAEGQQVLMRKECPDHGSFSVAIWPDVEHYSWIKSFRFPFTRWLKGEIGETKCPEQCGACNAHLRHPTLIEIEVSHSCNLKCPVCFASTDTAAKMPPDPNIKQLEEQFCNILKTAGRPVSIQVTGGEPTIRKDLADIIRVGKRVGFDAIEVNSNGVVVADNPEYIQGLSRAGVSGIYLQFDGLQRDIYEKTRGRDLVSIKKKAIDNCREAGVQVVLAMTVIYGLNHEKMGEVLEFALENNDIVAGVAYQPAFITGRFNVAAEKRISMGDVIFMLAEQSQGKIKPYDMWPLGCSHPLCSAATYLVNENGRYESIARKISSREYVQRFDPRSPQGSIMIDIAAELFPDKKGLSVVIMNYMDAMTMDLKRLQECSMTVSRPDGSLVPFCAYHLKSEK